MAKRSKPKESGWRKVYADFTENFEIDSKEFGRTKLHLWGTQTYVLDEMAAGMDDGIRFFVIPKGRQYGVTTSIVPLDVLWALTHPGIEGAIIGHKLDVIEVVRGQINDIQNRLPDTHRVPLKTNNKDRIEWQFRDGTVSTINLLVAGTSDRRTDLAKGHGLTFIHGTECAEWGSETAFNSLLASLAEHHPDRFYVFESTGEGANNLFARLVYKSLDHPARRVIFPPWWLHDLYRLDKRSALYKHYMANPTPTEDEEQIILAAKNWGHDLTPQELAWYRKKSDEQTTIEDMRKNYPSVIEDAFQLGSAAFIPRKPLGIAKTEALKTEFTAYQVNFGSDVSKMRIEKLGQALDEEDAHVRGANLRVWQEPKPRGIYAIGVHATDYEGETVAIQVLRCYSDCVEQVAEFSSNETEAYHLAWVVSYLAGWYKNCWLNIDLEHGGAVVFREIQNLRNQVSLGLIGQDGIFGAMVFYLYNRIDNVSGASRTWHWRSNNSGNEDEIYADFKNSFLMERLFAHSVPLFQEMATLVQGKTGIRADEGSECARSHAIAIGIRTWADHIRTAMIADKRTRESEAQKDTNAAPSTFLENIVSSFVRNRGIMQEEIKRRAR